MRCPHSERQQFKIHQKNGHALSTMYRCVSCRGFFSERRFSRPFCQRLTRLTNAFSRRIENLEAALRTYDQKLSLA